MKLNAEKKDKTNIKNYADAQRRGELVPNGHLKTLLTMSISWYRRKKDLEKRVPLTMPFKTPTFSEASEGSELLKLSALLSEILKF